MSLERRAVLDLGEGGDQWHRDRCGLGMSRGAMVALVLFVVSFAFDFKGRSGGSIAQYAMAVVNSISFLWLAAVYRLRLPFSGWSGLLFWLWVVFLAAGSVAAFFSEIAPGHYIRTIYPFVLFAEGYLVALWVGRDIKGAGVLVSTMLWVGIVSCVFTVWWGLHFTGMGFGDIRYQILSPLIPFVLVVGVFDLFISGRNRFWAFVLLVFVGALIMVSVTRGMFLVVGVVGAGALSALMWSGSSGPVSLSRQTVRSGIVALGVIAVMLVVAAVVAPDLWGRWLYRMFGAFQATSLWMRVAAAVGQWHQLTADLSSLLLGKGFGHTYHYASEYAATIGSYWRIGNMEASMWYPGEFMWITPLFYSGVLIGTAASGMLLLGVMRAVRTMRDLLRSPEWRSMRVRSLWLGSLGYLGFIGASFTANPFIFRQSALFMGLSLGLIYAIQSRPPSKIGGVVA